MKVNLYSAHLEIVVSIEGEEDEIETYKYMIADELDGTVIVDKANDFATIYLPVRNLGNAYRAITIASEVPKDPKYCYRCCKYTSHELVRIEYPFHNNLVLSNRKCTECGRLLY